jgi:undecaprenyl-diphosphatase
MIGWLEAIDRTVFIFINRTLSNPLGDFLWPLITDYDRFWPIRVLFIAAWLWLLVKGGKIGRTVALLVIPLVVLSDQLSSSVLKQLFDRARPCHTVNGIPIVPEVRLLVGCGSGRSFPSSHAVNNFAVATLFATYYRRWAWAFFSWAFVVALSRVAIGVHYPSDILGGALIGVILALGLVSLWRFLEPHLFPARSAGSKEVPGG